MSEDVETLVERLLAEVRRVAEAGRLPTTLSRARAARELDVSLSKLKGMIRSGQILTCEIGGRQHIPKDEILRLATPTQPKSRPGPKGGGPRKPPRASGGSEAEKIRALTRR